MRSLYSGLVSYWNLQDQSGSRLDLTGTGNTLTNVNTVTSVDGFLGQCSNFAAASSQRLTLASNASIQGGQKDYTFTAWVQMATAPGSNMIIVSKFSGTAGQAEYKLEWTTGNRFAMTVYVATDTANQVVANSFGALSTGVWYFVSGFYNNLGQTCTIEVNAGISDIGNGIVAQAASAAAFNIGSLSAGSNYWNGKIAEVGKWDRILTRQERTWLYNQGRGRTFPFIGGLAGLTRHARSRRANSGLWI